MKIRFLGATRFVTGSCYHLSSGNMQFLVDCGMYQGKNSDQMNRRPFSFNVSEIDCLLLTHAHLDHSGLLPKLAMEGFKGKIITTPGTAALVEIMLYDSAHIQEKDAEWMTKKAMRTGRGTVVKPLYTASDVETIVSMIDKSAYGVIRELGEGIKYRFVDAGHILGSSSLEIWYQTGKGEKKIVFSGDVGKSENFIIQDPQHIKEANYVVVESTYGNRLHKSPEDSIEELAESIRETLRKKGNILIPAFAVGRTQDLIFILNQLVKEGRLPRLDVYIDSPLADKATQIYLKHPENFDPEATELFRTSGGDGMRIHFTKTVEESQALNKIKSGAVIIAGSGMCEGGRIRHHFKHNLWRSECSIIFTGFQARGTLGRYIIDGAKSARVLGEEIAIRARVYTIGGFSAHADQGQLLEWLSSFTQEPEIFIVHGEEETSLEFEAVVRAKLGLNTYVPHWGDEFEV